MILKITKSRDISEQVCQKKIWIPNQLTAVVIFKLFSFTRGAVARTISRDFRLIGAAVIVGYDGVSCLCTLEWTDKKIRVVVCLLK